MSPEVLNVLRNGIGGLVTAARPKKSKTHKPSAPSTRQRADLPAAMNVGGVHGDGNIIAGQMTIVVNDDGQVAARKKQPGLVWREALLDAIREKAAELAMTEEQVETLLAARLHDIGALHLDGLKSKDMARVYEMLAKLKRPALN